MRPWPQASVSGTAKTHIRCHVPHQLGNVFRVSRDGNALTAYKITATNPQALSVRRTSMGQSGRCSPCVTTTVLISISAVGIAMLRTFIEYRNAGTQTCANQPTVTF